MDNNWIPTKAVEALTAVQKKHKGVLNERAVSEILSQLNMVWRNIMRQEVEAQKTKMSQQIQDLRRQIVTKNAYDKGELIQEITRTKHQLSLAEKKLHNQKRVGGGNAGKENVQDSTQIISPEDAERSIRLAAQMEEKVRQVTLQNETLKAKLAHYEHQDENQNTLSREHMRFTATDMNSNSEI